MLRIPRIMDADEAIEDLARHGGVWVQPGYFFDLSPGHLVLSLIGSPDAFTSGVHALTQRVRRWDSL